MVKITKFPYVTRYYAKNFTDIFNNQAQYFHFKQYVTGLLVCENKTLSSIQSRFIDSKSTNSLDHFMINSDWSEQEINRKRVCDLQNHPETVSKPSGVVSIDDTLNHKTGKHIEDAEWHYDHALKKMIFGHNIVSTQYKDDRVSYPLDYRLYHRKPTEKELKRNYEKIDPQIELFRPGQQFIEKMKLLLDYKRRQLRFKTKIELAIELIHETEKMNIKAKTYVFDSWFLCKDIIKTIRSYGKDWVSVLKQNRILIINNKRINVSDFVKTLPKQAFRKIKTKKGHYYWVFTKSVRVHSLGKVRIVISFDNYQLKGDPLVLVTNRKDWEPIKILNTYDMRWGIDAFYRDAKQHLGLEDYQLRKIKGIKRHWYLVFLAHTFLMRNALNSKLIKRFKTNISTIGQSSRMVADEITTSLILWLYRHFQNQKTPEEIVQCLLNA